MNTFACLSGTMLMVGTASAQSYLIDTFTIAGGSGTISGGIYSLSGGAGQPDGNLELSGGDFTIAGGFWSIVAAAAPVSIAFDTNLILNPGAEAGAGSVSANDILPVPNWTTTNNFTVIVYDSSFPSPGPGFGTNFFAGGPTTRPDSLNPFSSATQMIDVSALAPEIDTAAVVAEISGYFGGYGEQNDRASLTARYLDASGNSLGNVSIGNVLAVDRTNRTALLCQGSTNAVPANTRKIQVVLNMTNDSGAYYNDGYADNLSLVLRRQAASLTIFDNTGGSGNGYEAATTNAWLANKLCVGAQPYQLESVTLLLVSGDANGAPRLRTVRLQIYSNDPVSGKPSNSTGVIMTLSDATNPITMGAGYVETPIKWIPATPFTLAANTCYWVVLSTDIGTVGEIASYSLPTGDAGAYGRSLSADAGGSWQAPDNGTNRKMLIQATPVVSPPPNADLAADGAMGIPGGTGNFTSLPFAPGLSGNNLVFFGAGSSGQQGIYSTTRGLPQVPIRIADLNTPIPNGAGNFLSFGAEAGIIIVGGDILFSGRGAGGQEGVYLSSHATPGQLLRIADTATAIPGGAGAFIGFQNALGFSGGDVAFVGNGSGAQQGLYTVAVIAPPQVGSPLRVADTATAIPGGTGNFTAFPSGPALSGSEVAFIGNGSGAQQGLYTVAVIAPPQVGSPLRIADTATPIPSGAGNFTAFGSDQAHPVDPAMSGDRLAFVGSGSGGQQGIYGASAAASGPPYKVADTATAIPGGSGNFTSFDTVSVSQTDVAFLGHGGGGQTGIYDATGGQLRKVISVGDAIQGKTIAGLNFSRGGLFGDPIAFQATFNDGSQGVYTIDVPAPPTELRILAVERSGADLRLSFTSVAGQNYAIQSRAVLTSGAWTTLPGGPVSGSGGTVDVTLASAFVQPQQFYRVMILP